MKYPSTRDYTCGDLVKTSHRVAVVVPYKMLKPREFPGARERVWLQDLMTKEFIWLNTPATIIGKLSQLEKIIYGIAD